MKKILAALLILGCFTAMADEFDCMENTRTHEGLEDLYDKVQIRPRELFNSMEGVPLNYTKSARKKGVYKTAGETECIKYKVRVKNEETGEYGEEVEGPFIYTCTRTLASGEDAQELSNKLLEVEGAFTEVKVGSTDTRDGTIYGYEKVICMEVVCFNGLEWTAGTTPGSIKNAKFKGSIGCYTGASYSTSEY